MGVVRLRVDATSGVQVRVGQRLEKGAGIGRKGENEVTTGSAGVVESIAFDGVKHEFEVVIKAE